MIDVLSHDAYSRVVPSGGGSALGTSCGAQSLPSVVPSLSSSGSQASPRPSPSVSSWFALAAVGQLSTLPQMPSPSASFGFDSGQASETSGVPSLSSSVSQAFPVPSPSVSNWFLF